MILGTESSLSLDQCCSGLQRESCTHPPEVERLSFLLPVLQSTTEKYLLPWTRQNLVDGSGVIMLTSDHLVQVIWITTKANFLLV